MDSSEDEYSHDDQPVASTSKLSAPAVGEPKAADGVHPDRIKRKSGKKGKKFVEDKSSLLALISDISGEKDDARAEKLQRTAKSATQVATAVKTKAQRKLDRTAPLRATKKLLLEKEKEKKAQRKEKKRGPVPPAPGTAAKPKKKSVAFA